jgi:hypothetical protein
MDVVNKPSRTRRKKKISKKAEFNPKAKHDPLASLFGSPSAEPKAKSAPPAAAPKPVPKMTPRPRKTKFRIIDGIDPFELFAAYHLGLTADEKYRPSNINEVSRRFKTSPDQINAALKEYDLDSETVMCTDFDMGMAQIDMKVSPAGVSKLELARQLYQDYRDAPLRPRDWADELEKDKKANLDIYEILK